MNCLLICKYKRFLSVKLILLNTFSRFNGLSVTSFYHCLKDMFLLEKKLIQEVLWPLFCRKSEEVKMVVPVAISISLFVWDFNSKTTLML